MIKKKQLLPTFTLLAILWLSVTATLCAAADASFSWLPNTESDLAGYKIHYGTSSETYENHINVGRPPTENDGHIHYTISGLTSGITYYFAATAYNTEGLESDYSTEVVWTVPTDTGAGNTAPIATMTASPISGPAALEVVFDGSASIDADHDQLTYRWDFGDNTIATTASSSISHTYTMPGSYTATLQVDDGRTASTVATQYITVTAANSGGSAASSPTAAISLNKATGIAPLTISFDGTGSTPSTVSSRIIQYAWSFDDGSSGSGAITQHTYTNPGIYHVTLTVTDDNNVQDQATVSITVTTAGTNTTAFAPTTTSMAVIDKQIVTATLQQVYMLLLLK